MGVGAQVLLSVALVVLAIVTLLPGRRPSGRPRTTGRPRASATTSGRARQFRGARRTGPRLSD